MISIPFPGNKKVSYKTVKPIVEENDYSTVLEVFGGSGVLSVNLFNDKVVDKVILNDYDKLFDTYEEFCDIKDYLVKECKKLGLRKSYNDKIGCYTFDDDGNKVYRKSELLDTGDQEKLQSVVNTIDKKWWRLLSFGTNFCYNITTTHEHIRLDDFKIFSRHLETDNQRKYLEVVRQIERVSLDWKDFLDKYESLINENTLVILDPPYIDTKHCHYAHSFTEKDTVELLERMRSLNCDYIFFNNDESKVQTLLKDFNSDIRKTGTSTTRFGKNRKDVMAFVRNRKG